MKDLVFATNNQHKIQEVKLIIGKTFQIISLSDIGCTDEIIEDANTLEGNALIKSRFVFQKFGYNCFADDTGLEISALHGNPGVFSARYAGEPPDFEANIDKVLREMSDISDRNARFRTVISLILGEKEYFFEGFIKGNILNHRRGNNGFGYDSIFVPSGYNKTFAEMKNEEKASISHRYIALSELMKFLNSVDTSGII
ncbi:MAG: non-canonical purine NTP diphosphatase [Bacteroidetes bacterium]|nr:non-canonical purine NTP diphosphatase [Bacteroidota bacterium]